MGLLSALGRRGMRALQSGDMFGHVGMAPAEMLRINLSARTAPELVEMASRAGIPVHSRMTKGDLINRLIIQARD